MIKRVKMMLYGVPGIGKSVFALKFPKPFFITTDGNYEWLEDFGAKKEDHKQVNSWTEFVTLMKENKFDGYETIVIDLVEDLYKWSEHEFCKKNKIDHIGDMGYGKGYTIVRDGFFVEISKLLGSNKNVIILSHETSVVVKDKRGVESTLYYPSKTLPETLRDRIEGRLRYVLRAKFEDLIDEDKIYQKRILSLAGDSSEFGIIRGVDMNKLPDKIDLDYDQFIETLGLKMAATVAPKKAETIKHIAPKKEAPEVPQNAPQEPIPTKLNIIRPAIVGWDEKPVEKPVEKPQVVQETLFPQQPTIIVHENPESEVVVPEEIKVTDSVKNPQPVQTPQPEKQLSSIDIIREKLRKMKEGN